VAIEALSLGTRYLHGAIPRGGELVSAIEAYDVPAPADSRLAISVGDQGTTTIIVLRGAWGADGLSAMRNATRTAFERSPECVVLDLSALTSIDTSGTRSILELYKRTERQNVRLVIIPGAPAVQHPFERLKLAEALPFVTPT
jgi:anti-anti-sigma factor